MPYLIAFSVLCAVNGVYQTAVWLSTKAHDSFLGILAVGAVPLALSLVVARYSQRIFRNEPPGSAFSRVRWGLVLPVSAFAYFQAVGFTLTLFERVPSPVGRWFILAGVGFFGPWFAIALGAVAAPRSRHAVLRVLAAACLLALMIVHVTWSLRSASPLSAPGHVEFLALYGGIVLGGFAPRVA